MVTCRTDNYQNIPSGCLDPGLTITGGYKTGVGPMSVTLGIKASPCTGTNAATEWCVDWGDGTQGSTGVFISDGWYAVGSAAHVYSPDYGKYTCRSFPVTVTIKTACGAVESTRFAGLFEVCKPQETYPPDVNIPPQTTTDTTTPYPPSQPDYTEPTTPDTVPTTPDTVPTTLDTVPTTTENGEQKMDTTGLIAAASIVGLAAVILLTR